MEWPSNRRYTAKLTANVVSAALTSAADVDVQIAFDDGAVL